MAAPGVAVRCPACGTELRAYPAPYPPTQWFPCPHCRVAVPVVVPRDPPPLYTWEVLPSLYPPLDRPRAPRWRLRPAVAIALAAVAVAAAVLGGLLLYYGAAASGPGTFSVSGTVLKDVGGEGFPADGARVLLTDDRGTIGPVSTGPDGRFEFTGVPSGGVSINVTLPSSGYAPATLDTFVSPVYDAGSSGLTVVLLPTSETNGTTQSLAPFPTMESFLASVDGAAGLLGICALVAAAAAVAAWRPTHRTAGVLGGGAGIAVPTVVFLLGLVPAFPIVVAGAAVTAAFGAFALVLGAADLYRTGPPVGTA